MPMDGVAPHARKTNTLLRFLAHARKFNIGEISFTSSGGDSSASHHHNVPAESFRFRSGIPLHLYVAREERDFGALVERPCLARVRTGTAVVLPYADVWELERLVERERPAVSALCGDDALLRFVRV